MKKFLKANDCMNSYKPEKTCPIFENGKKQL